jgi:hypothetical protein
MKRFSMLEVRVELANPGLVNLPQAGGVKRLKLNLIPQKANSKRARI